MSINNFFDKIFIINLDESVGRWENIVKELSKASITNYERIQAIRLPNLQNVPPTYYSNLVSHQKVNEFYRIGITSANMSHIKSVRLAKERNYNNVLILEDDVGFRDDINEIFEKVVNQLSTIDWDMLYLGSNNQPKENIVSVSENLIKGQNLLACHAYSVRRKIYDKIINEGLSYGAELDNYYKNCIQPNFKCLCTRPRLVYQNNGESITLQGFRDTMNYTRDW